MPTTQRPVSVVDVKKLRNCELWKQLVAGRAFTGLPKNRGR